MGQWTTDCAATGVSDGETKLYLTTADWGIVMDAELKRSCLLEGEQETLAPASPCSLDLGSGVCI